MNQMGAEDKFAESDRIKAEIDENWKLVDEMHAENKKLKKQYDEAVERELGPVLPVLQKLRWGLDLFFDMGFLLGDEDGDLKLFAVTNHRAEVLKMFAPASRERVVCEGVTVVDSCAVLYLKLELGSLVKNVEWCLANGIHVSDEIREEKVNSIFECQERINAMYRLLKHGEKGQEESA